mmetsp:Transcript_36625/g.82442  ORF Transcript_36625/g.82442 Transcript_36625/m.82442 type:complete len:519 (-) Transcript_36625:50-1606(-)
MPLDYGKWDQLEDSDDEPSKPEPKPEPPAKDWRSENLNVVSNFCDSMHQKLRDNRKKYLTEDLTVGERVKLVNLKSGHLNGKVGRVVEVFDTTTGRVGVLLPGDVQGKKIKLENVERLFEDDEQAPPELASGDLVHLRNLTQASLNGKRGKVLQVEGERAHVQLLGSWTRKSIKLINLEKADTAVLDGMQFEISELAADFAAEFHLGPESYPVVKKLAKVERPSETLAVLHAAASESSRSGLAPDTFGDPASGLSKEEAAGWFWKLVSSAKSQEMVFAFTEVVRVLQARRGTIVHEGIPVDSLSPVSGFVCHDFPEYRLVGCFGRSTWHHDAEKCNSVRRHSWIEVGIGGGPWLLDFGLAQWSDLRMMRSTRGAMVPLVFEPAAQAYDNTHEKVFSVPLEHAVAHYMTWLRSMRNGLQEGAHTADVAEHFLSKRCMLDLTAEKTSHASILGVQKPVRQLASEDVCPIEWHRRFMQLPEVRKVQESSVGLASIQEQESELLHAMTRQGFAPLQMQSMQF